MSKHDSIATISNLIVIEGLDGSGTTTLTRRLSEFLRGSGNRCMETCEPTDSDIGKLIRSVLQGTVSVTADTLARLFSADRSEHLHGPGGIVETASDDTAVICDRYLFSSLAYQSIGCSFETVQAFNAAFPAPEITLFIDVPPEVCAARRSERDGVELFEHDEIQDSIVENYARAFHFYSQRGAQIVTIDGTAEMDVVAQNAWNHIKDLPIFL